MKNSKKKILVMTSAYKRWPNDERFSGYFIVELSKRLSAEFEVYVLAPSYTLAKDDEILDGIHVYRHKQYITPKVSIAYKNGMISNLRENWRLVRVIPFYVIFQLIELVRIVKKENIQIIHAHWLFPQGLVATLYKMIFNKKIKIIATIHGSDLWSFDNLFGRLLKKFIISRVDYLAAVSNALKNEVEKITSKRNIFVCPMGVDTNIFKPASRDLSLRSELGIQGEFLLFVGSCVEQKGLRYLIEAMKEICQDFPGCKLAVIGEGGLIDEMKAAAGNAGLSGNICFLGYIEHNKLPRYYATADIFILPSLSEGYSLVAREALSSGTPTIVTVLPVFNEDEGRNYFEMVPVKDSHQIAEKVKYMLKNRKKYEEEKDNMHKFASENYDWAKVTENYIHLIKSIG